MIKIPNNFKCMIIDISFYTSVIRPLADIILSSIYKEDVFLEVLCTPYFKELIIELSLARSLSEVFSLPIVYFENKKPNVGEREFENLYYSNIKEISEKIIFQNIDRNALSMFDGYEIIPFVRNNQLYLFSYDESTTRYL